MDPAAPSQLGIMRIVSEADVLDEALWGEPIELALEAEYWDTIVNSDHEHYPDWAAKVISYTTANPDADERLQLLLTAGAVFQISQAFSDTGVDGGILFRNLDDVLDGATRVGSSLPYHLPAQVFHHNNLAMRGLMLGPATEGLDHLEQLIAVPGTEGRAAAPFTYGMIHDEAAVRYAIELNEDCETFVCMWTSEIAPAKPIGQLMMQAELHAVLGEYTEMNTLLDRAEALAVERDWPFIDRIDALRTDLPSRTYTSGQAMGVGVFRWPMPEYSNEVNCSNCHVGARARRSGISVADPYEGHYLTTSPPDPPDLSHLLAP